MTLDDLLARLAPRVASAFREAIAQVTDNAVLARVVEAVQANDINAAFRAIDFDPAVFNRWYFRLLDVFEQGAQFVLGQQPKRVGGQMVRFNMRDRRAEEYLQHQSGTLISAIEADTRMAVGQAMQIGLAEGRNPRSTALDLIGRIDPATGKRSGGLIGLGARELEWTRNARLRLQNLDATYLEMDLRDKRFDGTVRRAIEAGTPLPAEVVDRLVDRYKDRALRYRAEGIARTETMGAMARSEWVAIQQMIEKGQAEVSEVTKTWHTGGDNRVRHTHAAMQGQTVGVNEPFVSPSGALLMHPLDASLGAPLSEIANCRCHVSYSVDFLARAQRALDNA